ncbi:hypothetical protein LDENG_00230640 [Lucifuga dentata]|nr:hypothetical protein LDENG_00230640 [Lucifuga dentata]
MVTKRGKVVRTEGWSYQKAGLQTYLQDSYKYLGIPQTNGSHDEEARRSATAKYLQRVRQVLRSWLNEMK